jgi:hypothetical protein
VALVGVFTNKTFIFLRNVPCQLFFPQPLLVALVGVFTNKTIIFCWWPLLVFSPTRQSFFFYTATSLRETTMLGEKTLASDDAEKQKRHQSFKSVLNRLFNFGNQTAPNGQLYLIGSRVQRETNKL